MIYLKNKITRYTKLHLYKEQGTTNRNPWRLCPSKIKRAGVIDQ
jgi:hypothetical protein